MKLLTQGDDYGFTKGVTLGIIEGIDNGILRNTGFFTNMESAVLAAQLMKGREDKACFGIDFNIVSGPSVSDPATIPALVDENGEFIRSGARLKDPRFATEEGRRAMFPYDQVYREIRAQYDKFVELTGRKPGYLHGHSLGHEHYTEAILQVSKEEGVPFSSNIMKEFGIKFPPMKESDMKASRGKVFDPLAQLNKDAIGNVLSNSDWYLQQEYAMAGGHPGFVDADLLGLTTLSLERCRDLQMVVSPEIKKWVEDNNIELITYYDLVKELEERNK